MGGTHATKKMYERYERLYNMDFEDEENYFIEAIREIDDIEQQQPPDEEEIYAFQQNDIEPEFWIRVNFEKTAEYIMAMHPREPPSHWFWNHHDTEDGPPEDMEPEEYHIYHDVIAPTMLHECTTCERLVHRLITMYPEHIWRKYIIFK